MNGVGRSWIWPWIFIGPCLFGLILFTLLPVCASFGLSFMQWNLLNEPSWVGLDNYTDWLFEPLFWKTLGNTLVFVAGSVVLEVILALALAVLLNRVVRGIGIIRTLFFLPVVTPMVCVALVWGWLYDPQFGWLSAGLRSMGGPSIDWLYDEKTALLALILIRVWKDLGYSMLILLAGLQTVPPELLESAALDGASAWGRFWRITLPQISPTVFFVITMGLINAFQAFDVVFMLTQGGPNHSTDVLVYGVYKNAFELYRVGPASALAYVLFLFILVVTAVQWRLRKKWVFHES